MHIPDGVLSPEVCAATGAVSAGVVGYSLYRLRGSLADRTIPLTGMMSALVFAGQMVNFPIGLPVSGHLMGGVLAGVILGPWAGCLAITLVLMVQCLLFADGGLAALGANVLHMGVIGSMGGYAVYAAVRRLLGAAHPRGIVFGAVTASWLSVMAAAALFCAEFRLSWPAAEYDFSRIFALMVAFHSLIGIGEALITGAVVSFVLAQRPELIYNPRQHAGIAGGLGRVMAAGTVCALAVAAFLAPFASGLPDGLEAVAQRVGFDRLEAGAPLVLEDYQIPLPVSGWTEAPVWQKVSVSLAGFLGTGSVLAVALLLGRTLKPHGAVPTSSHAE